MSTENTAESAMKFATPAYLELREDGAFILLANGPSQDTLRQYIGRVFDNEAKFSGLDYQALQYLLFGNEPLTFPAGTTEVRIAQSISPFPKKRRELYKKPKVHVSGASAEYFFEPVFLEEIVPAPPATAAPDQASDSPNQDAAEAEPPRETVQSVPAHLDFDEFVAAMWLSGVQFGLHEERIRSCILEGRVERMEIAAKRDPTESRDATIVEVYDKLHLDLTPVILPNGRVDLRRVKNRFPQVSKDTPLIQKIPRTIGHPGYQVSGRPIEPRKPLDVNLTTLAGPGIRVDISGSGETLVANADGFVNFDGRTHAVSITDKIENKSGISLRSTGDISLDADQFVEHGEVQEGRNVEGHHLTFMSAVYGNVVSKGGVIQIRGYISGGTAQSTGGQIHIKGRALNSMLEARDGELVVEYAEECTLVGKKITAKHLINCELVAETILLDHGEGCSIIGKSVDIASAAPRKYQSTNVVIVVPDLESFDRKSAELALQVDKVRQDILSRTQEVMSQVNDPVFEKYFAFREKIRSGAITLSDEQKAGYLKLDARYASLLKPLDALQENVGHLHQGIDELAREKERSGLMEHCHIKSVTGEIIVRTLILDTGIESFLNLSRLKLKAKISKTPGEVIFQGDSGSLSWNFRNPQT